MTTASLPATTVRPSPAALRPCRLSATWRQVGGPVQTSLPAVVRGLSARGLCLLVRKPCLARMIFVTLYDAEGKPVGTHLLWNRRCTRHAERHCRLHGVFVRELSSAELQR
ncbi:MAG: hypothetical protein JNM56_37555, partial [Planctomycetia bacterium]|nr:hypothetical protein [Planctomycetia bacterium]